MHAAGMDTSLPATGRQGSIRQRGLRISFLSPTIPIGPPSRRPARAFELLEARIKRKRAAAPPQEVIFPTRLMVRDSCARLVRH